jgi:hypothetical protein
MGKYFGFKIAGYYLYFTSHCIVEPLHSHASDSKLSESGSAKIWVKENGDTIIANQGTIDNRDMGEIREFIKDNVESIKNKWEDFAGYIEFVGGKQK